MYPQLRCGIHLNLEGGVTYLLSHSDSGGPGTYSQMLILKEYMSRLASDLDIAEEDLYPADYFDLMGGVGFGGLVALLLGHLRMNVDDAIDALITVATTIFPGGSQSISDPENNSKKLKEAIENILQTRRVPLVAKMHERNSLQTRCKVTLYATNSTNIRHSQAFRTYSIRGTSLNPTIVEALCATMATPSYFLPVRIGWSQQSFVGGALGANNPTRELLKEAGTMFGNERRVAQIISLGCGVPRLLSLEATMNETGAHRLPKEIPDECEAIAKELAVRLYDIDDYLRLSVEKGIGDLEMDQWNMLGEIEMHTAGYIEEKAVTKALEASLKRGNERSGTITLGHLNKTSSIKIAAKIAPSVSPYFVLRKRHWEKLVWHLVTSPSSRQRILPITGTGGCGKTQLVSYFLQEYPTLFKHTVYVDASTLPSIEADLQAWVRTLGDGHERDSWEDAVRVLSRAPEEERWGLILDNADDPKLNLNPILPKNLNLTIVITSRNPNLGNLSTTHHIELGEMEHEEAISTLLYAARRQLPLSAEESRSVHTLLKELGCLAVALVQVGTYCHELSHTFTQYLKLLNSHRAELMMRAEPSSLDNYRRGAYTTLDLSYKALPQATREFLHFISFFHHTNIPLSALATAAKRKFSAPYELLPRPEAYVRAHADLEKLLCVKGNWDEMQVHETLRTLRSFSLISISSIDDSIFIQLHPLTQAWSRDMDPSVSQHRRAMVLQVLTACQGDDAFLLRRYLLPHLLDLLDLFSPQDAHVNDLLAAGAILQSQGQHVAAARLFEAARETIGSTSENNERNIATISGWLAAAYWAQGRYSEAETLQVEVLEMRKWALGIEHPDTIIAAANLAVTYDAQGRWSEAVRLKEEVVERRRRILGTEHPDTIVAVGNLAVTYHAQGRWSEAAILNMEVLERRRRLLGMQHPATILVAANLADTYRAQGRLSDAEVLEVQVLEHRKRTLGTEHPDTILVAANLADTYRAQGRLSDAETLGVQVLEQRRRILGTEHPDTMIAAGNLAATYQAQGNWSDAVELKEEVFQQRRRIHGMEHPATITAAGNLAVTYGSQGRLRDAEELELVVLEQRRRLMGMEHPATIMSAANLAATYGKQGRWEEDAAVLAQVVQLSLKVLGEQHPDTQARLGDLAFVYQRLGK